MESSELVDPPLLPRAPGSAVPLTALQRRMWTNGLKRGTRLSELRTCAVSTHLSGPLHAGVVRESLAALVGRHESLRTRFVAVDGKPQQQVDPARDFRLQVLDLSRVPARRVDEEAKSAAQMFVDEKIDLACGPVFDARLLKLSDLEHVLIVVVDHIVSDNVSCSIIDKELWTFYNQGARSIALSLPPLEVQFSDYAAWQERTYPSWLTRHAPYWNERLAGARRIDLPCDTGGSSQPTRARLSFPFGLNLSAQLRQVAWQERTLLPLVVLAAYVVAMARWSGQRDFVLAFASHGRQRRKELSGMIGCLATPLYLPVEMSADESFIDLLHQLKLELSLAYRHQDFGRVPDFNTECTAAITFNWLSTEWTNSSLQKSDSDSPVERRPFEIRLFAEKIDPNFRFATMFRETPDGIVADAWYRPDLFLPGTIKQFGRDLCWLAQEFTRQPTAPIALKFASS